MSIDLDKLKDEFHSIYVIEGPGAVYVGCTCLPVGRRWQAHLSDARRGWGTRLHSAMRAHGDSAFRVTIVAQARGFAGGRATEDAVIAQLLHDGVALYNMVERDARHPLGFKQIKGASWERAHRRSTHWFPSESAVRS